MTPTDAEESRERSLSGVYLSQAAEQLRVSGDAHALYPEWFRTMSPVDMSQGGAAAAVRWAKRKQVDACRASVLFSALAAEAYVNEFLAVYLEDDDFKSVERMSTVNKYARGTQRAVGETMFEANSEPLDTIARLFELRHRLVHPKPGDGPPSFDAGGRGGDPDYNAVAAAHYLLGVSEAAALLVRRAFPGTMDMPADILLRGENLVLGFAHEVGDDLPRRKAKPPPDLVVSIIKSMHFAQRSQRGG